MRAACSAMSATACPPSHGCGSNSTPPAVHPNPSDDGTVAEDERSRGFSVLSLPSTAKLSPTRQGGYFAAMIGSFFHGNTMYARAGAAAWEMLHNACRNPMSLVHNTMHIETGMFLPVMQCRGKVL